MHKRRTAVAVAAALFLTTALATAPAFAGGSMCLTGCDPQQGQHQRHAPRYDQRSLEFEMNTNQGAFANGTGKNHNTSSGGNIEYDGHQDLGGGFVWMDFQGGAGSDHADHRSGKDHIKTYGTSGQFVAGEGNIRAGDHRRRVGFEAEFGQYAGAEGYGKHVDGNSNTWGQVVYDGSLGASTSGGGGKFINIDFSGGAASDMAARGGREAVAVSGQGVFGSAKVR